MRPDNVIMSCDDNPFYADLWPVVSNVWFNRMLIHPVLVKITDHPEHPKNTWSTVVELEPITGVDVSLQAQLARFWYASTIKDEISIISDVDMIPISHHYFKAQLEPYSDSDYIHINPIEHPFQLPACYHVASGYSFQDLLNIPESWPKFVERVMDYCKNRDCAVGNSHWWKADEVYTTEQLYTKDLVLLPREGGYWNKRIDRGNWDYDPVKVKEGECTYDEHKIKYHPISYVDAHLLRPYSSYKKEIDALVELLV
jgi:hypothetical protein